MARPGSTIRIANSCHGTAESFSYLRSLPWVTYEENSVSENAVKLHNHEVDVAFIPVTEFATHGDYVGLDFGIACSLQFQRLILHSVAPLTQLQTVYLHPELSTGAILLRILLLERWNVSPRIVRLQEPIAVTELRSNEAVLIFHKHAFQTGVSAENTTIDIVQEWQDWTGSPVVLNVWATRSTELTIRRARALSAALYKSCSIYEQRNTLQMQTGRSLQTYTDQLPEFSLYLSEEYKKGLEIFFERAARAGLLPEARYANLQLPLNGRPKVFITKKSCETLLDTALQGKRLSLTDAIYLAENAPLADLGIVADTLRRRLFSESACRFVLGLQDEILSDKNRVLDTLRKALDKSVSQIILYPDPSGSMHSLAFYEERLRLLRSKGTFLIEGFGAQQILTLAAMEGIRVREVAERLVSAGLDIIPSWGGEMFFDQNSPACKGQISRSQWLRVVRWMHRFGARSSCSLNADASASWTYIVSHLHVLRQLQDLTGGICYFCNYESDELAETVDVERRLRIAAIARLFLDNIPAIHEVRVRASSFVAPASLSFGSNAAYMLIDLDNSQQIPDLGISMKTLLDSGMTFSEDSLFQLGLSVPHC